MTPKLVDYGHRGADKELTALIRRLHLSYRQARVSLFKKVEDYLEQYKGMDEYMRSKLDSGELSHEDYMKWRYRKIAETKQWQNMANQLADDLTNQNRIAASMIDDTLPGVYALNHNYGTFEAEKGSGYDTTYTMYDKFTVKRLLTENEDLLPHPSVPIEKDKLWNKQHLQSAMLQGVLTGDSMKDIAKRFRSVVNMTEASAMRNARTAVTGAENAGRIDSYVRAEKMGIKLRQMWLATLDGRTRDSHAMLDGEQQEVGKPFSNGCRYPGDPKGAPAEIYNCRCTLVAVVEGADPYNPNLRASEYLNEQGLTYDEWKQMHQERYNAKQSKSKMETENNPVGYSTLGMKPVKSPRFKDYSDMDKFSEDYDKYRKERKAQKQKLAEVVDKAYEYKRFNTKEDIMSWAEGQAIVLKPEVLTDIDIRVFNETSVALDEMFRRFPEVKNYKIETFEGEIFETKFRIGIDNTGMLNANNGLNFNPNDFKDYKYALSQGLEGGIDGWSVKGDGTFSTLIRHEYGHRVKDYIESNIAREYHAYVDDWRLNFQTVDDYKKSRDSYWEKMKVFDKELLSLAGLQGSSEYSNTNDEELFAEGFAAFASGEDSEFARAFGELLKRWY